MKEYDWSRVASLTQQESIFTAVCHLSLSLHSSLSLSSSLFFSSLFSVHFFLLHSIIRWIIGGEFILVMGNFANIKFAILFHSQWHAHQKMWKNLLIAGEIVKLDSCQYFIISSLPFLSCFLLHSLLCIQSVYVYIEASWNHCVLVLCGCKHVSKMKTMNKLVLVLNCKC